MELLEVIAGYVRAPMTALVKLFKPKTGNALADDLPAEGDTWPTPLVFGPYFGPPGAVVDAAGKVRYGMTNAGKVPVNVDTDIGLIEEYLATTSKTGVLYKETKVTCDAGGALAPTTLVAAPGAGSSLRTLHINFDPLAAATAGGSLSIADGTNTHTVLSDGASPTQRGAPVNCKGADNTAISVSGSSLGVSKAYLIGISYRVETP